MRARIFGCRGSLATPGPETVKYGGNTSSVEIVASDGSLIILDAGTGIRTLGLQDEVRGTKRIHLLLSHLHLDHLEGLGFFTPLWDPEVELHIWGPPSPVRSLERRIARYLSPPLFPVPLSQVPSRITFHDAPDGDFEIGGARVWSQPIAHAGPAVGYRVEDAGASLAYLPDHEPARGERLTITEPEWISGFGLADGADVLLHDSQYTEAEYPQKAGWGHSSVAHVVDYARVTGAKQLVLFHHDPTHDDDALQIHEKRAAELWGRDGNAPVLAYEGMEIALQKRTVSLDSPEPARR